MNTLERLLEFTLPSELEAHQPPEARGVRRDGVRLLVSERATSRIWHQQFTDLPDILRPGDLLVANDSATIPAALTARRNGDALALHLSTRLPGGIWVAEPRIAVHPPPKPMRPLRRGEQLELPGGARATLLAPYADSTRLWLIALALPDAVERSEASAQTTHPQQQLEPPPSGMAPPDPTLDYLRRWGRPIRYPYVPGDWPIEAYQTVYARAAGSAEMPSAGRAFTSVVLDRLKARGIGFVTLTLHTGVASLEAHEPPYAEWYHVPAVTATAVNAAKARGRRVIAVGTTVVRALESATDVSSSVIATRDWTELVITPERGVQVADGLLTGFHEPKATHLAMLEAIAGRDHLARAYAAALKHRYLWHEFGDLHLIL
jgi:S-adenosylmethionine:tRNA ribosyltransferase-isomerase